MSTTMTIAVENIPAELKAIGQWVCWRYELRKGKQTKVPYQTNGVKAETNQPDTWTTFEKVLTAYQGGDFAGIGFVFSSEDDFAGIDLDDCVDDAGEIVPEAQVVVDKLNSYSEISPSGKGVKIFVRGALPTEKTGRKTTKGVSGFKSIEMYHRQRYFTTTGNHLVGTPLTVECREDEVREVFHRFFGGNDTVTDPEESLRPASPADVSRLNEQFGETLKEPYEKLPPPPKPPTSPPKPPPPPPQLPPVDIKAWARTELARTTTDRSERDFAVVCQLIESGLSESEIRETVRGRSKFAERNDDYFNLTFAAASKKAKSDGERTNGRADIIERAEPLRLAEHYLESKQRHSSGALMLRRWRGENVLFNGRCYTLWSDEALDAALYSHLDQLWTIRRDSNGEPAEKENGKPKLVKLVPKKSMVGEVRAAIPSRDAIIDDRMEAPCWLDGRADPDPANVLVCRNGLLNLVTGELLPHTPQFLAMNAVEFDYDPDAPEPVEWLSFLESVWGKDHELIDTLQEWFGYVLSPWTGLQKILLVVGPKRSGKGTIARVLTRLLGTHNVAGPTLGSLATQFGLAPLLHKPLAIISDARLSGRTDQAIVTERLLSISGEDTLTVDIKHRDAWTGRLPTRIAILTNELPRLNDASGALAGRFIVLPMTLSFFGREDHELEARLIAELPGILNWAIEGWRRLRARGRFVQPASSAEAIQELEELGSPISAFVRDKCVLESGFVIEVERLYDAWKIWCEMTGREKPGTIQTFGRDLLAAFPALRRARPRVEGERVRIYEGIRLQV